MRSKKEKAAAPSKPFDSATKNLVERDPIAWLRYVGLPGTTAELLDADLSTITTEADRILRVHDPDYLAYIELQATYKPDMGHRTLRYNTLAFCRYLLPVQSIIILLRKEADGPAMSGQVGYVVPQSTNGSLRFEFRVVRVWEKAPEDILAGPLATLPLAPLADVSAEELPSVVQRMEQRLAQEASAEDRDRLWVATYLLMGLRFEREFIEHVLKGVLTLKESTTYMAILEEGEAIGLTKGEAIGKGEEARSLLLRLGQKRFGQADKQTRAAIEALTSLETLEHLAERLLEVESWEELLREP